MSILLCLCSQSVWHAQIVEIVIVLDLPCCSFQFSTTCRLSKAVWSLCPFTWHETRAILLAIGTALASFAILEFVLGLGNRSIGVAEVPSSCVFRRRVPTHRFIVAKRRFAMSVYSARSLTGCVFVPISQNVLALNYSIYPFMRPYRICEESSLFVSRGRYWDPSSTCVSWSQIFL